MTKNNIHRLLAGTIAFIMIIGFASPAFGLSTTGTDPAPEDKVDAATVPAVDCDVDTGIIVAYETSKGQTDADFSTVFSDLTANGFEVRTFNISIDGIPSCITKMMISSGSGGSCVAANYPASEIDSIKNWVSSGGELLLLNEWADELFNCGDVTDDITAAFGEAVIPSTIFNQIFVSGTNYDPSNPATLWSGVADWEYFAGTGYDPSIDSVATTGSFPAGDPVTIAKEFGQGCVLMIGDTNVFDDIGLTLTGTDGQKLGLNSFLFLNECAAPAVGGELLSINMTSLFVGGFLSNAIWMLPAVAGIAGTGIYFVKYRNKTEAN